MNFQESLNIIKNSDTFKSWNHPEAYLVSCFSLDEKWQFAFYSRETKKVSSFSIEEDKVNLIEEDSRVFQKKPEDLEKLDLNEIKIELDQAIEMADKLKEEKAPSDYVSKKIIILQHINAPLWNISYITSVFNIINIKINAINSKVIAQSFDSIMNFKK